MNAVMWRGVNAVTLAHKDRKAAQRANMGTVGSFDRAISERKFFQNEIDVDERINKNNNP